jgi:hypothetical protein
MIAFRSGSKDDADIADVPSPGSNIPASIRAFVQRAYKSSSPENPPQSATLNATRGPVPTEKSIRDWSEDELIGI